MVDYGDQLVDQQFLSEQIFNAPGRKLVTAPRIGALAAVVKETTATLNEKYNGEKKQDIQVIHPMPLCTGSVGAAPTSCTIVATEPSSGTVTYALDRARTAPPYKLAVRKYETSLQNLDRDVALNSLYQEKWVLEDLNKRIHTFLNTLSTKTDLSDAGWDGISTLVDGPTNDVMIAPADWTAEGIVPLVTEITNRLMMTDPYIIDGGALWALLFKATKGMPSEAGKVMANYLGDFRFYSDWQMAGTLSAKKFFIVERGVLAILNRPDWPNAAPQEMVADTWQWAKRLQTVNGETMGPLLFNSEGAPVNLQLDMRYQRNCEERTKYFHSYETTLNADIAKAPVDVCAGVEIGGKPYTGIIAVRCGVAAAS